MDTVTNFLQPLNPDLSKPTCRVCLQNDQDENMSSIFDLDADLNDIHIYEKIEQCAGIEVSHDEKMPTLICRNCLGLLQVSFKFRTTCQSSNDYLRELVLDKASSPKLDSFSCKENPLSITEDICETEKVPSRYKTRLRRKPSPLLRSIKNEEQSLSNSPTRSGFDDDFIDDVVNNLDDGGDDEVWFDIGYNDDEDDISCGENYEASTEEIEMDIKEEENENDEWNVEEETKKSNKTKKTPVKYNKNKPKLQRSKTLEISADGSAIIREKKPREKREKKGGKKREKGEKQPHICHVCGNIYQRQYSLEAHMKRHTNEKPFECEICGVSFFSNGELIRHMRKHTGDRPFKCSFCPRAFGDKSTLIKHERIHRNDRPFKCKTCGKSFTYSNVLKYHIYTHTGEKAYKCEICGKCFNSPHHLRSHLRTLQHQNDPRTPGLIINIRRNNNS